MRSLGNKFVEFTVAGVFVIILIGCNTDARRIREINEILATPPAERTSLSAEIDYIDIQHGDCINSTLPEGINVETVVIVPCAGPWQYRVLSSFEVASQDRYPGETFFEQQAYARCDRGYSVFLYPLAESWRFGDRTVSCLQESFGLSTSDPKKLDRLVNARSLSSGDCFNQALETDHFLVELVDCSADWELQVLNSFEVDDSDHYPGSAFFDQHAFARCDDRHTTFFFPLAESWRLGDRMVICLQNSFGLSASDPAKLNRLVRVQALSPGNCINEAPETNHLLVELTSCAGSWQLQVINTFVVQGDGSYPGDDYVESQTEQGCRAHSDLYFGPSDESWDLGDRKVICVAASASTSSP